MFRKIFMSVFIVCLVVGFGFSSHHGFAKNASHNQFEGIGKAYLDIPLKGWTSLDQTKTTEAQLHVKDINISGTNLQIGAILQYNGHVTEIKKDGEILKSYGDHEDYIFNFDERRGSDTKYSLVFASMRKNISENKLYTNRELSNKNVLQLAFFNNEKHDLIVFETPIDRINSKAFTTLQNIPKNKLDITKTDSWAHKVVKPSITEAPKNNLTQSETANLAQSETAEAEVDYTVRADYDFGWGVTSHYATANTFSSLQYPLSEFEVDTLFEITDMWVDDANGEVSQGWSNWRAGNRFGDSISTSIETFSYNANAPDYIRNLNWSSNGMSYSSNKALSLALNIGVGPLTGGIVDIVTGSAERRQLVPVYNGGNDYPHKVDYKFDNSEINEENSDYYVIYGLRHAGDYSGPFSPIKKVSVRFHVPWHILHADETLEVPSGIDLYYVSR